MLIEDEKRDRQHRPPGGLRNWCTDAAVMGAQSLLAAEAAAALRGHEAIWAWDLGNENSNCVIPPSRESAQAWRRRMSGAIRDADDRALVVVGLHMEDLEEDCSLGSREAAQLVRLPLDARLTRSMPPGRMARQRWFGVGKDVRFGEFCLPLVASPGREISRLVRRAGSRRRHAVGA